MSRPEHSPGPHRTEIEAAAIERILSQVPIAAGLLCIICLLLPGLPDDVHPVPAVIGALIAIAFGVVFGTGLIPIGRVSVRSLGLVLATLYGIIALVIWATGGANSYVKDVFAVALIFVAYFFPTRRLVMLMTTGLLLVMVSPLAYTSFESGAGYLPRSLFTIATCYAVAWVVMGLKNQLLESEQSQREMALRDPLTDLPNRRAFDAALEAEVTSLAAHDESRPPPTAVLFFDLDRFKLVNDIYGHTVGDHVLMEVARLVQAAVRPGDLLARIGGDEFAVVAPRAGHQGAQRLANQVDEVVSSIRPVPDAQRIGTTVAFSLLGVDGNDVESVMHIVDRRLHDGKRSDPGEMAGAPARPA